MSGPAAPDSGEQNERLAGLALLVALGLFVASRVIARHPLALAGGALSILLLATVLVWARARLKDGRARRRDPKGPGVIVGSVRGDWPLARRRPFVIPWGAFKQHLLITGPTGRGKTFTFIKPLLRANVARSDTGVFYLDGKGDPVHRGQDGDVGVVFDAVFCPEEPSTSACWNPLAGADPVDAARQFAAALYPAAGEAGGNFYEQRAVFAITTVAPALALTGYDPADPADSAGKGGSTGDGGSPGNGRRRAEVVAALGRAGLDLEQAAMLVDRWGPERAARQLAWLPFRAVGGADLAELIRRNAPPSPHTPLGLLSGTPRAVTPAQLNRVLFGEGTLDGLAGALRDAHAEATNRALKLVLRQLRHDVHVLTTLAAKERAAMLSNLQNQLGLFLRPPFLELCSRSDFTIADVVHGRRFAFLLPVGTFPEVAAPLGRVALAQFRNAVLASAPGVRKVAVLEEFGNFIDPSFAAFLAQARSRDGSAIVCLQSISQLARYGRELVDEMLASLSTVVVCPGSKPFDARYWSESFGAEPRTQASYSYEPHGPLERTPRPSVRLEQREMPRFTPTEVTELDERHALIQVVNGRTAYPATRVDVHREALRPRRLLARLHASGER